MRIIGGDARGRTLVAPAGEKTRPTQDYVRESLFNIIRWDVEDARVLDLFAGTGALSLEAVSRGARSAVLVDTDRAACAAIKKNMETSRLGEKCRLIARDYRAAMDALASMTRGCSAARFCSWWSTERGARRCWMRALRLLICATTAIRRSPSFAVRSGRKKEAREWIPCFTRAALTR